VDAVAYPERIRGRRACASVTRRSPPPVLEARWRKSLRLKMGASLDTVTADRSAGPAVAGERVDPNHVSVDPASLGWRYTDHAIAYMTSLSRRHDARLFVVPITGGRQFEILQEIAGVTARLRDTTAFMQAPSSCPAMDISRRRGARRLRRRSPTLSSADRVRPDARGLRSDRSALSSPLIAPPWRPRSCVRGAKPSGAPSPVRARAS